MLPLSHPPSRPSPFYPHSFPISPTARKQAGTVCYELCTLSRSTRAPLSSSSCQFIEIINKAGSLPRGALLAPLHALRTACSTAARCRLTAQRAGAREQASAALLGSHPRGSRGARQSAEDWLDLNLDWFLLFAASILILPSSPVRLSAAMRRVARPRPHSAD